MEAASCSSSLAIREFGHVLLSSLIVYIQHRKKQGTRTDVLHLCFVASFFTLLSSQAPVAAEHIQINAFVRVASGDVRYGLPGVTFFDEVLHKCLVADRTAFGPCEGIQRLPVVNLCQSV